MSEIRVRNPEQQFGIQATVLAAAGIFGYQSTLALSGGERAAWLVCVVGFLATAVRLCWPLIEIRSSTVTVRTLLRTRTWPVSQVRRFSVVDSEGSPYRLCQVELAEGGRVTLLLMSSPNTLLRRGSQRLQQQVERLNQALGARGPESDIGAGDSETEGAAWTSLIGPALVAMIVTSSPLDTIWKLALVAACAVFALGRLRSRGRT